MGVDGGNAGVMTSKLTAGKLCRSMTSRYRAKAYDGSGSPWAADSPTTKMRNVAGGFSAGIAKAGGSRKAPGGKNCHVNRSLSQKALRSWTMQGTVNSLWCP
jgi:hypothetical protein